jgi:hypothetical protein
MVVALPTENETAVLTRFAPNSVADKFVTVVGQ